MSDLKMQIEHAFNYRGDVTVNFKDGTSLVGFLANRNFEPHASLNRAPFIELFLPDGSRQEFPLESLTSIEATGVDHADHSAS
jgi:hypothetical protein